MDTPPDTVEKEVAKILEVFNRICDEIVGESRVASSDRSSTGTSDSPKKRSNKSD